MKVHWFTVAVGTQTSSEPCRVQRRILGLPEQVTPALRELRAAETQHSHLTAWMKDALLGWLSVLYIRNYAFKQRKLISVLWTIKKPRHRTPAWLTDFVKLRKKPSVVAHPWTALWRRRMHHSGLKLMKWDLGGQSYIWFHSIMSSSSASMTLNRSPVPLIIWIPYP